MVIVSIDFKVPNPGSRGFSLPAGLAYAPPTENIYGPGQRLLSYLATSLLSSLAT